MLEGNEEGYFTAILLKKGRVKFKSQEIVPFPNTKMMRNLLCVNVSLSFRRWVFCLFVFEGIALTGKFIPYIDTLFSIRVCVSVVC